MLMDPQVKQKIADMVVAESTEYIPNKAYGLFIFGKRISSKTGTYFWRTEGGAKKALAYHLSFLKNSFYLKKYQLISSDVDQLYRFCLEEGIAEIRPIGDI